MGANWQNKIKWNKIIRYVLPIFGILAIIAYNFILEPGIARISPSYTDIDYKALSSRWIESAFIFGIIQIGSIVFLSNIRFFALWIRGKLPNTDSTKRKLKMRLTIGLLSGLLAAVLLVVFLFLNYFLLKLPPIHLAFASAVVIVLVLIMDCIFKLEKEVWNVDIPILFTVIAVLTICQIYMMISSLPNPESDRWILGFSGGAIAFQLIAGCILTNPNHYDLSYLFKNLGI